MNNKEIFKLVRKYTMTDGGRINAAVEAVRKVIREEIRGDIVECGVYKGGATMAMMLALLEEGDASRDVFLYDTFDGMTEPEDIDVNIAEGTKKYGTIAKDVYNSKTGRYKDKDGKWCKATREEVEKNLGEVAYPNHKIHYVEGKVEDTLPLNYHERIAVLRLDTDFYASTNTEMAFLYPKLQIGGVLLVDDYYTWGGCKKAVDEYFAEYCTGCKLEKTGKKGAMMIKTEGD